MNISNKMLLNAAKCQGYSFYRFWVIEGKYLLKVLVVNGTLTNLSKSETIYLLMYESYRFYRCQVQSYRMCVYTSKSWFSIDTCLNLPYSRIKLTFKNDFLLFYSVSIVNDRWTWQEFKQLWNCLNWSDDLNGQMTHQQRTINNVMVYIP